MRFRRFIKIGVALFRTLWLRKWTTSKMRKMTLLTKVIEKDEREVKSRDRNMIFQKVEGGERTGALPHMGVRT